MTLDEKKALLDLAKTWQAAADLHKKAIRRNRSFAQPGSRNSEYHQAKAAHEEIRAELYECHSKSLVDLVSELSKNPEAKSDPVSA